ncbi:MAG: ECF transporter S component [Oscillospiraceae bacterium]|nr:ECF transporter S component [Oscillospiraceae bacterium]
MKTKKKIDTRYLVQLALLIALELILAYTPLGYFRTAGLEISFLMIPVTLGAILLGPAAGAILGGIFGLTSFGTCFGVSLFGSTLLGINPFLTFLVCVPTRLLAGWLTGVIFKALYKAEDKRKEVEMQTEEAPKKAPHWLSFGVASLAGPVLNTLFFMGFMVLFFYSTDYIQGFASALGAANPFVFIVLFVGIQGLIEAVVGFIASSVIGKAVYSALHRS